MDKVMLRDDCGKRQSEQNRCAMACQGCGAVSY